MNDKNRQKITALDCAYIATFVALVIAVQLALSFVPGVELVTVLFVTFSFAFGAKRGMIAAVAFALLRQFVFGVFPTVLILYLIYFPLLALLFGALGRRVRPSVKNLIWLTIVACVCTVGFSLLDCVITPLWYAYTAAATRAYFYGSLSFMIPQVVCTAVSVALLFLPLTKVFSWAHKR